MYEEVGFFYLMIVFEGRKLEERKKLDKIDKFVKMSQTKVQ
jgi:hypothetical protein